MRLSRTAVSGLACSLGASVVLACVGCGQQASENDKQPTRTLTLDWRSGSFAGITLRSTTERVITRLGRPARRGADEPVIPMGDDYSEVGGPTFFRTPGRGPTDRETLRFEDRAFIAVDGRIAGWVTTSERSATTEGVGVGDSRRMLMQRYPDAHCFMANEGSDYETFPLCEIRACRGRLLAFGGDPVKSIWLIAETRRAWRECRQPTRVADA